MLLKVCHTVICFLVIQKFHSKYFGAYLPVVEVHIHDIKKQNLSSQINNAFLKFQMHYNTARYVGNHICVNYANLNVLLF